MSVSNKRLAILFVLLYMTHVFYSILYGLKVPWGGDEWFSYNNFILMGLPFSFFVSLLKFLFGPLTADNYIFYRQQGMVWTTLIFIFLFQYSKRSNDEELSKFAVFLSLFILVNPYTLQMSQFFRYYQLYIATSVVITFIILQYDSLFTHKRKLFYMMLLASIFIHLFILVQLITYIFFKELFLLDTKRKTLIAVISGILLVLIIPNLPYILVWSWHNLFPTYAFDFSLVHRGFSLSTLLKPFMIIFTFMFGKNLTPFSYKFLDICYIISGISIIYGIITFIKNKPGLRQPLIFGAILPLIFSVFIIEPISLPQMTQLAPQHVIFLFPWLAYIFFELWNFSVMGRVLNIILFSGLLYAGYLHQAMDFVDWGEIESTLKSNNTPIITDAPGSFNIFLDNKDVLWFEDEKLINEIINRNDTVAIILTNWKNYQEIEPLQFWHNPKGTKSEYNKLLHLFLLINNSGFGLMDGYTFFPIQTFTFVRNSKNKSNIPYPYDMKYRDLKLPLIINGKKIIGFEKIGLKQSAYYDSIFYYFIQTDDPNNSNNLSIEITYKDSTKKQFKLNQEDDTFRSYYCRSIVNDSIVHSYNKMPLVSNSMRYPGSMFNSEGKIFKHEEFETIYTIKCNKPGLTLFRAIISDK